MKLASCRFWMTISKYYLALLGSALGASQLLYFYVTGSIRPGGRGESCTLSQTKMGTRLIWKARFPCQGKRSGSFYVNLNRLLLFTQQELGLAFLGKPSSAGLSSRRQMNIKLQQCIHTCACLHDIQSVPYNILYYMIFKVYHTISTI